MICSVCQKVLTENEAHTYANGFCACGEPEPASPGPNPGGDDGGNPGGDDGGNTPVVTTVEMIPAAAALAAIPAEALTAETTAAETPAEKDNDIKITNRSSLL